MDYVQIDKSKYCHVEEKKPFFGKHQARELSRMNVWKMNAFLSTVRLCLGVFATVHVVWGLNLIDPLPPPYTYTPRK